MPSSESFNSHDPSTQSSQNGMQEIADVLVQAKVLLRAVANERISAKSTSCADLSYQIAGILKLMNVDAQ